MHRALVEQLRAVPMYARLEADDLAALAQQAHARLYTRGQVIFRQGEPAERFYTIVRGRVKVARATPDGREVILAILGPGDPVGAVAVYLERPFPATAEALEDTVCVHVGREAFRRLLHRPSFVEGLLLGMTLRIMELTGRVAAMSGTRVEPRLARLFLRLGKQLGRTEGECTFVPLHLSRQELADLTGTTIETCIRVMSRWHKEHIVRTEPDGFRLCDAEALERIAGIGPGDPEVQESAPEAGCCEA